MTCHDVEERLFDLEDRRLERASELALHAIGPDLPVNTRTENGIGHCDGGSIEDTVALVRQQERFDVGAQTRLAALRIQPCDTLGRWLVECPLEQLLDFAATT